MLTEPDMQARYIGASLGVIQSELQTLNMPESNRQALCALVANAARAATQLADDLEGRPKRPWPSPDRLPTRSATDGGNVLAFKPSKRA